MPLDHVKLDACVTKADALKSRADAKGWSKEEAERFLHQEGSVTNIGQISPEGRRHLDKLVKSGHAVKGEDPYWAGHHAVWSLE